MTTITATEIETVAAKLTAKGLETMVAVANWNGSFFDDGCTAGSGIWGECFMNEMGHKSTGVINRLRDLGLFDTMDDEDGVYFVLTELGVAVAKAVAADQGTEPVATEEVADEVETTIKRCGKWTRFYQNGVEVGRVHNDAADAVFAVIRQG